MELRSPPVVALLLALLLSLLVAFAVLFTPSMASEAFVDDVVAAESVDVLFRKASSSSAAASPFQVGIGRGDITGPVQGVQMMGYAMLEQIAEGLSIRLFARAYIIGTGTSRVVVVNLDSCMTMQGIKVVAIEKLQARFGSIYRADNVLITGTHTHSGPGAYSWYALYDITSLGFSQQNFDAVVDGIVQAVTEAHNSIAPTRIFVAEGKLYKSNINRSPTSYLLNPADERAQYPDGDTDKTMTVFKFVGLDGHERGLLSWFPVHGTSIGNKNHFVSGDNKGIASLMVEAAKNPGYLAGQGPFVAAFVQANAGDVSPNILGAFCPDNTPCDATTSTCNGKTSDCMGRGPAWPNEYKSAEIIGENQADFAMQLFASATEELDSAMGVDFRHTWLPMTNLTVSAQWTSTGKVEHTCRPAMGAAFAAGTTDGCGENWFHQHETHLSPFWDLVRDFIAIPTAADIACQDPKPILLPLWQDKPIPWAPTTLPLQVLRIGRVAVLAIPGEPTTMAGRRLKSTIVKAFTDAHSSISVLPLITGLANTYASYVTSYEEFGGQRYEAASTIFGPHELAAYQQETYRITSDMAFGRPSAPGVPPIDLRNRTISFIPGVIVDEPPPFGHFGQVHKDANDSYQRGTTVEVVFWGANPRNNLQTGSTYLTVERQVSPGNWKVERVDTDLSTWFHWKQQDIACSLITIRWDIESDATPGSYRIRYFGSSKALDHTITPFTGVSKTFSVA